MLPDFGERVPGDYTPERLVARAKVHDAPSLKDALKLLSPREKAAALGDDKALERLLALGSRV